MVTLLINLEDRHLQRLLTDAIAANVSLDEHIKQLLSLEADASPSEKSRSTEDMLSLAIERAKKMSPQTEFKLQQLFSTEEWTNVSPTVFGRDFRKAVESQGIARHLGKDPQNKARYERM